MMIKNVKPLKESFEVLAGEDDRDNHIFSVLVKRTYTIKNGKNP